MGGVAEEKEPLLVGYEGSRLSKARRRGHGGVAAGKMASDVARGSKVDAMITEDSRRETGIYDGCPATPGTREINVKSKTFLDVARTAKCKQISC